MNKLILVGVLNIFLVANIFGEIKVLKPKIININEINCDKEILEKMKKAKKIYTEKYEKDIKLSIEEEKLLTWASEKEIEYSVSGGGDNWYNVGGPYKIYASSELKNEGQNSYYARNAHDDDLRTAWAVKEFGIGQYIEYRFKPLSPRVTSVILLNGYIKTPEAWKNNSRAKKIKMYVNNEPFAVLEVEDSRNEQIFEFEPLQSTNEKKDLVLKFEIVDIYKGEKFKDLAITELRFDGLDVLCFPKNTKINMADGTIKYIQDINVGDEILSYDYKNNKIEIAIVKETAKALHENLIEIDFGEKRITVTDDHPFYSVDGWKSYNPKKSKNYKGFESIKLMSIGDMLVFYNEKRVLENKKIVGIKRLEKNEITYTITKISTGNNFIAEGAVVGVENVE